MAFSLLSQFSQVDYTYTTTDVTTSSAGSGAAFATFFLFFTIIMVVAFLIQIKIFTKAGRKWWEAIIPIYNIYVLLQIVGRPGWWLLLFLIPFVNVIVSLIVMIDLAKSFGKSTAFGIIGLWIFSLIGYIILAFGDAKYVGASASGGSAPTQPQGPPPQVDQQPPVSEPPTPPTSDSASQPPTPPAAPPTNLVQ